MSASKRKANKQAAEQRGITSKLRKAATAVPDPAAQLDADRRIKAATASKAEIEAKYKVLLSESAQLKSRIALFETTADDVTARKLEQLKKHNKGQATAILCLNDWHLEQKIDPAAVSGLNEYNLEIAYQRVRTVFRKAMYLLHFARNLSNIRELVVWLGGDLINGYIHEELEESNFAGPAEAVGMVQDLVAEGLEFFLREADVKSIIVPTSQGNHGRSVKKPRIATGYKTSWEYLAYCNLARTFRNEPKIAFKVEQGYLNYLDIQGHCIRFNHGDAVKFAGGVGGVHIPLRKRVSQWDKGRRALVTYGAHWHQFIPEHTYVVSGCVCGYDAFAQFIGAEFQAPCQALSVIDRTEGKVMDLKVFCA